MSEGLAYPLSSLLREESFARWTNREGAHPSGPAEQCRQYTELLVARHRTGRRPCHAAKADRLHPLGVVAGGAETFFAAWSGVATASAGQPANGHLRGRLLLVHGPPVRS